MSFFIENETIKHDHQLIPPDSISVGSFGVAYAYAFSLILSYFFVVVHLGPRVEQTWDREKDQIREQRQAGSAAAASEDIPRPIG